MKVFLNGLLTGLVIQTAIGPVFFFIINLALQRSIYDGMVAIVAVTIVDFLYIALAIVGVGKLLANKKVKKTFGIISSMILIIFGLIIIRSIVDGSLSTVSDIQSANLIGSFMTTFLLAISNPMVIVWNTSLLTAKAVEYNYDKQELITFGISVGLATLLFMGISMIFFVVVKKSISPLLIQTLNTITGSLLILYGAIRLTKVWKNNA
jgi:arginine exporter protein ArgO